MASPSKAHRSGRRLAAPSGGVPVRPGARNVRHYPEDSGDARRARQAGFGDPPSNSGADVSAEMLFLIEESEVIVEFQAPNLGELAHVEGDLRGRRIGEVFPPALMEALVRSRAILRDRGGIQKVEYVSAPAGGPTRHFELRTVACPPDRVLAMVRDITGWRRLETELRQSRENFRSIFQSLPVPAGLSTLDEGRFLDVNETFLKESGFTRDEVVGKTGLELDLWVDRRQRDRLFRQLSEFGTVRNFEAAMRTKGGAIRRVLVGVEAIELSLGACLLFVAVDLTERHRLEEQLWRVHRMEAIGHLAGGLAHDFKNVVGVIQCNAALLQAEPSLSPKGKQSLGLIRRATGQAGELLQKLLTLGRRRRLEFVRTDLNEVVRNVARMLPHVLGDDVDLELSLAPRLPRIMADTAMIEQALLNLALNARDAMPEGGWLSIRTGTRLMTGRGPNSPAVARARRYVVIVVEDSGVGIAAEALPHIFEPFYTTKGADKGIGLGLAVVSGFVQQHQGWIDVKSAPGRGTAFTLFLPRSATPFERRPGSRRVATQPVLTSPAVRERPSSAVPGSQTSGR